MIVVPWYHITFQIVMWHFDLAISLDQSGQKLVKRVIAQHHCVTILIVHVTAVVVS